MKGTYTVAQVNRFIEGLIGEEPFLARISVTGEVSNLKYHPSGHVYFTLKDSAEKAALSAVMFRTKRAAGLTFPMQNGDKVICSGHIGVYRDYGTYQIYCDRITPDGTGELYLKYERLKEELRETGMFDSAYKKSLPRFPRTVGIVTADTGAAIRDIISVARTRNPYVQLILCPALVQGKDAPASIIHGIETLDAMHVDVMIIGRGGGSIEDLWAFNEESVARAVFSCSTPVISAVGHETDTVITDFVADARAETPTAAAVLAVPRIDDIDSAIVSDREKLMQLMQEALRKAEEARDRAAVSLRHLSPARQITEKRLRADALYNQMQDRIRQRTAAARNRTQEIPYRLRTLFERRLTAEKHRLKTDALRLEGLSPAKKLAEGYGWAERADGVHIRSTEDIAAGDAFTLILRDGSIDAEAKKVESNG